jgi:hypothetical protein
VPGDVSHDEGEAGNEQRRDHRTHGYAVPRRRQSAGWAWISELLVPNAGEDWQPRVARKAGIGLGSLAEPEAASGPGYHPGVAATAA